MKFGAKWFLNQLIENVTWENYKDHYFDSPKFTSHITEDLCGIIKKAGLTPSLEYFRIDVTGWRDSTKKSIFQARCKEIKMKPYLWDLKIAVEHENNGELWLDELIKLMHIRCPLKVIISYANHETRDDAEHGDTAKLSIAADMIRETEAYCNAENNQEEILIILGNGGEGCKDIGYRGYLYNYANNKFFRVENEQ